MNTQYDLEPYQQKVILIVLYTFILKGRCFIIYYIVYSTTIKLLRTKKKTKVKSYKENVDQQRHKSSSPEKLN